MLNPRLETFYEKIICEDFIVLYNFTNITLLPKFEQAILSSTSKSFGVSKTSVLQSFCAWRISLSQKSISTRARKSIALFNLRKETLSGLKTTLRKKALFSLLDKALIFVLPISISKKNTFEEKQIRPSLNFSLKEKNGDEISRVNKNNVFTKQIPVVSSVQKKTKSAILILPTYLKYNQREPSKIDGFSLEKNTSLRDQVGLKKLTSVVLSKANDLKKSKSEAFTLDSKNNLIESLCLSPKKRNVAFLSKLQKNWEKQKKTNFTIEFFSFDNLLEENLDHNRDFFNSYKRKTLLLLKKDNVKTNEKTKSFFTISNSLALSFPEILCLSSFFDILSGFSLTFSLKKRKSLQISSRFREESIKKQLLSAFGFPKI